jgi:hypothetical protein
MKRLVVSISAVLVAMYLSAMPPTTQRTPSNGSPHSLAEAAPKTPGEQLRHNKKVSDKLSALLRQQNPPVTDLQSASQGFKSLGQFVVAVHASDNLGIPFDQLKTAAQTSGGLGRAIHVIKPDVDVEAAVREAVLQALEDLDKTPGQLLAQNKKLSAKLSALLRQQDPPVTDLQTASQGFTNLGQLFAVAHISLNLGIPFDQLKTREQTSRSLGEAIHALKPNADTKAELWEAAVQAADDLQESYWGTAQPSSTLM